MICPPHQILFGDEFKKNEVGKACGTYWKKKVAYRVLVGKPEGKRPLARPRGRWLDNTKMYFKEVGWRGVDWIVLAQGVNRWQAVLSAVMNFRFP
jgi:hypothetical protein